ncbi:Peripheral plasma membrane protein CASK [Dirofilaria immitis]|nr:Peripheral plasma membrane protein CASK [Dirofilaria immitis]
MYAGQPWTLSEETVLLNHHYQLGDAIEHGPLSTVYRAVHRITSKLYSVKSIDLQKYSITSGLTRTDVDNEIEICAVLKHPFLCELKDVIAGEKAVHMVFEFLDGDDICFEIVKRASAGFVYSEAVASHYMRQLMQALEYMHGQGIIHRDIRPHNIVLASKDNSAPLKLTGFGVSMKLLCPTATAQAGRVGMPYFMAPEVVSNAEYGTKADMWSAGVLLYILLCGRLPFVGSQQRVYESITEGRYSHHGGTWQQISDSAKDLLIRLLTVDPNNRISAEGALNHEWLRERSRFAPRKHLQSTVEQIRRYNTRRKLKSNILSAVNNKKWTEGCGLSGTGMIAVATSAHSDIVISGDLLPGGDTCDADGCTRRGLEQQIPEDLSGVEKILTSLDQITALADAPFTAETMDLSRINSSLENADLKTLLTLYDRISNLSTQPLILEHDSARYAKELCTQISGFSQPSTEIMELRKLLESQEIQAILQAHDVIIHEIYEGSARGNCIAVEVGSCEGNTVQQQNMLPQMSLQVGGISIITVAISYLNGGVLREQASHAATFSSATTMNELPQSFILPMLDDDDDLMMDSVSRVRLVQFQKDTEEPMGITLKVTEDGRCQVARIMHGGLIHRQATLHVGDEIREINGVNVLNQSVEMLQRLLRDARGVVTFKIVPSYRSAPPACEIFVRAQFDYDPEQDDLIPCPQAGVSFKTGDILQVISKDDHNWWQARYISQFPALGNGSSSSTYTPGTSVAGLIPSPELQEWRTACLAMERAKDNTHCMWFNKKKNITQQNIFKNIPLYLINSISSLTKRRKTLVLLGAHGVGRRHIKNTLIHRHPQRFAYPIPHTTRHPRKDEIDGKHYFFVSNDCMLTDIQANEYLEYGTHEECMYGTKLETIRNIHRAGKMAILDVEPQALKVLRTAEYAPFVVFIAAPNLQGLQDPDGSLERLLRESEILRQAFGHVFDYVILNNDIDETIRQLELIVEKLNACPQWIPVSWVY